MHRTFVCLVLFLFFAAPLWALQPEEGPGFLTDSHGAMAVIEVLLELGDDFPDGEVLLVKTLQWYDDVKIDRDGAYSWMRSTSAPEGHMAHVEDYRISAKLIEKCAAIQKQYGENPLCRKLIDGAFKLLERNCKIEQTKSGPSKWLPWNPNIKKPFFATGHSHGPGAYLAAFSNMYRDTADPRAKELAIGIANLTKDAALEKMGRDRMPQATWLTVWPDMPTWRTGWCYGTAGVSFGLMDFHDVFPDYRFYDGSSALDMAHAGMNWVATKRVDVKDGCTFERIRAATKPTENIGWGSGVGGIGATYLRGYQYAVKERPKQAKRHLELALAVARHICNQLEGGWDYVGKTHVVQDNKKEEELNLGFCGGLGGTHIFLLDLADAIESTQPELAQRCRRNCDVVGGWFVNRSIRLNDGIAWHGREKEGGDKVVSLAIDYGLTGMVIGLHKLAVERPKPDYEKAWRGATRGLVSLGVTEGAGLKWPWYTRSEEPYR